MAGIEVKNYEIGGSYYSMKELIEIKGCVAATVRRHYKWLQDGKIKDYRVFFKNSTAIKAHIVETLSTVTSDGKKYTVSSLQKEFGFSPSVAYSKVNSHLSGKIDDYALTHNVLPRGALAPEPVILIGDEPYTAGKLAAELGLERATVKSRMLRYQIGELTLEEVKYKGHLSKLAAEKRPMKLPKSFQRRRGLLDDIPRKKKNSYRE